MPRHDERAGSPPPSGAPAHADPGGLREAVEGLVDAIRRDNPEIADVVSPYVDGNPSGAWEVYLNASGLGLSAEEAHSWLGIAAAAGNAQAVEVLSGRDRARPAPRRRMGGGLPPATAASAAAPAMAVPDLPARLPGRVVVARVGAPDSREGRELARAYGPIVGKRLPFAGRLPAPGRLRQGILARWPWAAGVADVLEAQMAVLRRGSTDEVRIPPILLVGPPGCGKTSLALAVADMLALPRSFVPAGGTSDAGGLSAFTRGWATSRPAAVTQAFLDHGVANPAMVVDELDKSSRAGAQNGSVQGTLLAMVGRGGAHWHDACLLAPVDLGSVSWLATANDLGTVDAALAERFLVIGMEGPRPRDFDVLSAGVAADFARDNGLRPAEMPDVGRAGRALLRRVLAARRSARAFAEAHGRLARAAAARDEECAGSGDAGGAPVPGTWLN